MAKRTVLTFEAFLIADDKTIPWSDLSQEEKVSYTKKMMNNTSQVMSAYYTQKNVGTGSN